MWPPVPPQPEPLLPSAQAQVDTATLIPELFPGCDWDCRLVADPPICRGDVHHDPTPVIVDSLCESPFVSNMEGVRYSTRHYGQDKAAGADRADEKLDGSADWTVRAR